MPPLGHPDRYSEYDRWKLGLDEPEEIEEEPEPREEEPDDFEDTCSSMFDGR